MPAKISAKAQKEADAAALLELVAQYLAAGALERIKFDIPPDVYDLSPIKRVVLTFPPVCTVARSPGTAGDGYNLPKPQAPAEPIEIRPTPEAVELFLERILAMKSFPLSERELWKQCSQDADKGMRAGVRPEAVAALKEIEAAKPLAPDLTPLPPTKGPRTPAKRIGDELIKITVERRKAKAVA